jgi:hypothetical protein
MRQFTNCGGLAYAIHTDNEDHIRLTVGRQGVVFNINRIVLSQQLYDFVPKDFVEF